MKNLEARMAASGEKGGAAKAVLPPVKANEVRLSDGRIIEMREATGADEMIVPAQLGKVFTSDGAGSIIYMNCLIIRTVVSIDGKPVEAMRSFEAYRDFMGNIKGKDLTRIKALYNKLNDDVDDEEGNDEAEDKSKP